MSEAKGIDAFYLPAFVPTDEWPDVNVGHEGACGWLRYGPKRVALLDVSASGTLMCHACHRQLKSEYRARPDLWRYCPTCGARVVLADE